MLSLPGLPAEPSLWFVDTNIILRLEDTASLHHAPTKEAITWLLKRGDILHINSQVIAEVWNVITLRADKNGMGLTPAEAATVAQATMANFSFLVDDPAVFPVWLELCVKAGVMGKQVHDTRLAAVMYTEGIQYILTINVGDFTRFTPITRLVPISPLDLATAITTTKTTPATSA